VNGNDANVGFTDTLPANPATTAKKTLAALAAIVPVAGAARTIEIIIAAGTYTDSIDVFNALNGYANFSAIRGTGTNATAGATAFAGDTNDQTYLGGTTAAGLFAPGYNPTGAATSATITCQQVGAGAPAFAAEPLKPLGCRVRFDINTTTVALRGKTFAVIGVPASNQLTLDSSITFTASDVFYIEDPGVVTTGSANFYDHEIGSTGLQFVGIAANGSWSLRDGRYSLAFCQAASFATTNNRQATFNLSWVTSSSLLRVGPNQSDSLLSTADALTVVTAALFITSIVTITNPVTLSYGGKNVIGTNATIFGGTLSTDPLTRVFGGPGGAGMAVDIANSLRVLGNLTLNGTRITMNVVTFPSTTQAFGVDIVGTCDIVFPVAMYGGLKTDVGIDTSQSVGSRLTFICPSFSAVNSPHLTGVNGDVGLSVQVVPGEFNQKVYESYAGLLGTYYSTRVPNGDLWVSAIISPGPFPPTGSLTSVLGSIIETFVGCNFGGSDIPARSVVRYYNRGDSLLAVQQAQAGTAAGVSGAIGVTLGPIKAGLCGLVAKSGMMDVTYSDGTLNTPGLPVYISNVLGQAQTTPPAVGTRQIGWSALVTSVDLLPETNVSTNTNNNNIASWPVANFRYYAVDVSDGDDAFAGFSDTSLADAGTKAVETIEALAKILPRFGDGRKVEIAIRSSTYAAGLQTFLSGLTGYAYVLVRATSTNATANSVAFAGDAADYNYAGAITATGANAAGYNPTSSATGTTLPTQKVGGGASAFPAELAANCPYGWRIRFSATTTTVALRNKCLSIIGVPTSANLSLDTSITWASTDVFFIEKAGVVFTNPSTLSLDSAIILVGLDPGFVNFSIGTYNSAFCSYGGISATLTKSLNFTNNYTSPLGGFPVVGGNRINGSVGQDMGALTAPTGTVVIGALSVTALNEIYVTDNVVVGTFISVSGGYTGAQESSSSGAGQIGGVNTPVRILGGTGGVGSMEAALLLRGTAVRLGAIDTNSTKFVVGVKVFGQCAIDTANGTGNSLSGTVATVGMSLIDAQGSTIVLGSANVGVTGASGDIQLNDGSGVVGGNGVFAAWADVANFNNLLDGAGNRILSHDPSKNTALGVAQYPTSGIAAMLHFSVVRVKSDGTVTQAQANSAGGAAGVIGVTLTPQPHVGAAVLVVETGPAWISFDAPPTIGQAAYLSIFAGQATTSQPPVAVYLGVVEAVNGTNGRVNLVASPASDEVGGESVTYVSDEVDLAAIGQTHVNLPSMPTKQLVLTAPPRVVITVHNGAGYTGPAQVGAGVAVSGVITVQYCNSTNLSAATLNLASGAGVPINMFTLDISTDTVMGALDLSAPGSDFVVDVATPFGGLQPVKCRVYFTGVLIDA
jgi:hypothetical protein